MDSRDTLSTKFDGHNYPIWQFHFKAFIRGKGLLGILDGSKVVPTEDTEKEAWEANNGKIITWLVNSVSVDIAMELTSFEKASEMWSHLHTLGNQQNLAREFELERLLAESIQAEKNVRCFYSALLTLWAEQDQVFSASIPAAGLKDFMTTMKRTRTVQFLMKLRPEFEHLRASILNREKLPALEVVVSEVLREETRLRSQSSIENSLTMDTALAAYKSFSSSGNSNKPVQCYHCKETGHIISHCKKRNYCNYCKKDGHIILECRKKSGPGKRLTPHKAFQAMARDAGTRETPSTKVLDRNDIYKMIQESLVAALPNAISSALTATYPEHIDRGNDGQGT